MSMATDLRTIPVLDHGLVRLVDHMGSDVSVIRAARCSYAAAWKAGDDADGDKRLLRRMWTGGKKMGPLPKHSTPFEAVTVTFEVEAPIFVFRQWHRHRTQAYNELSARFRPLPDKWYLPDPTRVGRQSKTNKQGTAMVTPNEELTFLTQRTHEVGLIHVHMQQGYKLYENLLAADWPRELARIILPVAMYSHMFATTSLLNWLRFLDLRDDEHAQYEIKVYAEAIATLLGAVAPETMALYREARA